MKHIETIKAFIKTLRNSGTFHALVIHSAPGWGKSTTIDAALKDLQVDVVSVGAYATPLHIYKTLCQNPSSLIVFDDCAGLFSDVKAMSLLKAATWQSSGHGVSVRRISWGSSSDKVEQSFVDFTGKLILLTNILPSGTETEAFISRCLSYRIGISESDVKEMLLSACRAVEYFSDTQLALSVVQFLIDRCNKIDLLKVNLRTLRLGYDLAATHPEAWQELFQHLLPRLLEPKDQVRDILSSGLTTKEQEAKFVATTGKSRRSFYNYKKKMGLTRAYQRKS
ncbi:MAG: hypothetical protein HYX41_07890 [Bdellovibrio sp.]|nr:hypothetical protein [Bdellovibrio sp.]